MKVTIAIDSLKGSLSSLEAGRAIGTGVKKAWPEAEVCVRPLADGGEGTVEAVTSAMGGEMVTLRVTGPLGEPVDCVYGVIRESRTAVLEMAGAAGLTLLKDEERNPLKTTTYGVGEVIRDAVKRGAAISWWGSAEAPPMTGESACCRLWALACGTKRENRFPLAPRGFAVLGTD